ncbi:MAG: cytochrome c3 family protein [Thermodesulfobacteriota bacterium]
MVGTSIKIISAAILMTALFSIKGAQAKSIKSFFMPGPVISGHAKYEQECSNCHKSFSKESQKKLCLDCHKKVALDLKEKRGYHSREKRAGESNCQQCHKEHRGRTYKAVIFDGETFDHNFTDFPLKHRHTGVKCAKCHKKEKKYREAPSKCYTCHKDEDTHKGRLGKDCKECHESNSWTKARFDHKETDFPLKYKHKKASCAACHPGGRYKKTPLECLSCHRINDVHNGKYGKKCGDCHKANDWKKYNFDHGDTDFPLKFRHKKVDCHACHKGKFYEDDKLKKTCYGCHKDDDEHKGRYGKKCKDCHSPRGWAKAEFDHEKTDFPLKDKHRDVLCVKCHQGKAYGVKKVRTCSVCHKKDDVHRGREGRDCEQCHNQKGWKKGVVFDHDITKFPLIGLHAVTLCEQCHNRGDYKKISVKCIDCHKSDDKHKEGLGELCGDCHNPNGWRIWRFKHSRDTEYTLGGAHKGLDCAACHKRKLWKKIAKPDNCFSCHQDDDIHRGSFGLNCIRCHSTKSFKEIKIKH